jgi:hypothetical protein
MRWWLPKRRTRRTGAITAPVSSGAPIKPSNPFFFPGLSPVPAWSNALLWKDFHFLSGGYITAGFKVIGYGAIILLFVVFMLFVEVGSNMQQLIRTIGGTALAIGLLGGAVELALIASRVFWEETRWNTWPALVMLPRSLAYVGWSKVGGMALSVIPALLWTGLGFLINLDVMVQSPPGPFFGEFLLGLAFALSYYVLFLHATTYLSLWVKWGALPLAFVLLFIVGPMFLTCCAGVLARSDEGMFAALAFIMALLSAGLHLAIGYRLAELAER